MGGSFGCRTLADGHQLTSATAERVIRLVAACIGLEVHARAPIVSAELLERGERFEGVLPPIVRAPTFAIRKRAMGVIRLDRYVASKFSPNPKPTSCTTRSRRDSTS